MHAGNVQGMNMKEIRLHRDDLEQILKIVDQLNPPGEKLGSGMVVITEDNSSGIGSIVTMKCAIDINGLEGWFVKEIVDESSW